MVSLAGNDLIHFSLCFPPLKFWIQQKNPTEINVRLIPPPHLIFAVTCFPQWRTALPAARISSCLIGLFIATGTLSHGGLKGSSKQFNLNKALTADGQQIAEHLHQKCIWHFNWFSVENEDVLTYFSNSFHAHDPLQTFYNHILNHISLETVIGYVRDICIRQATATLAPLWGWIC